MRILVGFILRRPADRDDQSRRKYEYARVTRTVMKPRDVGIKEITLSRDSCISGFLWGRRGEHTTRFLAEPSDSAVALS